MSGPAGAPVPAGLPVPAGSSRRRRDELRRRLRAAVHDRASALMVESWSGDPTGWLWVSEAVDLAVVEYELLLEALGPLAALTPGELGGR